MTVVKHPVRSEATPTKAAARIAIVRVEGHVERSGLESCDYAIQRAGDDIRGAVVDLTSAQHVDYRAVDILVKRRRALKAKGRELAAAAGLADVRHLIRAAAGSEVPVFPTLDEAVAWVRGESDAAVAVRSRSKTVKGR